MRRHEREITDHTQIEAILKKADFLTLAMLDGGEPYCVPLNFGFRAQGERITLFIHGAKEGKKIKCIKEGAQVSFCAVGFCQVAAGPVPCAWTSFYESVCGSGKARIVEDTQERQAALECILHKYGFEGSAAFPDAMLERTCIIKIDVASITGKAHTH